MIVGLTGGIGSGNSSTIDPTDGADGQGGGGGGCQPSSGKPGADGGSGIVVIRRETTAGATTDNLTLQSNDTTASTANPDYADMVMLIENAHGTATLNTDIKGANDFEIDSLLITSGIHKLYFDAINLMNNATAKTPPVDPNQMLT